MMTPPDSDISRARRRSPSWSISRLEMSFMCPRDYRGLELPVISRPREGVLAGQRGRGLDVRDQDAQHPVLLLDRAVHDQDRLQVGDLAVALVDGRPEDDVDVAELVGQGEELEFLAGRGRLAGGHQPPHPPPPAFRAALSRGPGIAPPHAGELPPAD